AVTSINYPPANTRWCTFGAQTVHQECLVMRSRRRAAPPRIRVGRVSLFFHHGNWWLYYRDAGKQVRRKICGKRDEAEQVAAQINAQLTASAPTLLAFTPISLPDLRQQFLGYHE